MKIKLLLATLVVVLFTACVPDTDSHSTPGGGGQGSVTQGPTTAPAANGKVDCAKLTTAAQQLLAVQFLAQLKSADTIAAIKAKQIGNLDLDVFLTGMHDLHALDGYSSPLGDPKEAIDFYEKTAQAAKVLFATDPVTQDAIDAYNADLGTTTEFLGHQVAIAGAMDAADC